MTTTDTSTTHPFKVGRMVYPTLDEAMAKAKDASDLLGEITKVVDRATGRTLASFGPGQ